MLVSLFVTVLFVTMLFLLVGSTIKIAKTGDVSQLKWVIYILNLAIAVTSLGLAFLIVGLVLSWSGQVDNLEQFLASYQVTLNLKNISTLNLLANLLKGFSTLGLLLCTRIFLKNITKNAIFIMKNVHLARLATVFLLLGSLMTKGVLTFSVKAAGGSPETYRFLNLSYLLAAVLVWTISIILEKAVAIAEENEFTI